MRRLLWAVWLVILAGPPALGAAPESAAKPAEWPQWRGPNRDGVSTETGLLQDWEQDDPQLAWTATGLGEGLASISIQDGRIFTMGERDGKECVFALELNGGKMLWATPVGETADNGGYPGPRCTPTLDGELVYAIGSHGDLVACKAATGEVVWKKYFPGDFGGKMMSHWGYSESPLVDGDKLVCTPGGTAAMMVALDKKTGKELWRCAAPKIGENGQDGAAYSSIVVSNGGGRKQYVQLTGRGVIGVAADDGKFLWGYNKVANKVANVPTPLVSGDYVFCSTAYGAGSALLKLTTDGDGVRADEVYFLDAKTFQNHHGGMVIVGDHLYGGHGTNNGFPICIAWKTGQVVWGGTQRGPGSGSAAIAYADDRLYIRYQDGTMALVGASPDGYQLYGSFQIPGAESPSWPYPVIAGGKLYLREQDALLCYKVEDPAQR